MWKFFLQCIRVFFTVYQIDMNVSTQWTERVGSSDSTEAKKERERKRHHEISRSPAFARVRSPAFVRARSPAFVRARHAQASAWAGLVGFAQEE